MSRWFGFEQRWRDELLRAALPAVEGSVLPAWADLDAEAVWTRFDQLAPPALHRAWRATVWLTTLRPLVRRGRPRRFGRLSPAEQDARLIAMSQRRSRVVSQLSSLIRLVACIAYMGDEGVRAQVTDWVSP